MRDRNGVALDGGGDLEGGGEGETRTKTYYVRKKLIFNKGGNYKNNVGIEVN